MDMLSSIFAGFGTNLLITAVTFSVCIIVGILLSVLAKLNKTVGKIFEWLSLPFECISIPIALILVYFSPA